MMRRFTITTLILAAVLALAGCSGAGGGAKYTAEQLEEVWSAHAQAAKWDMEIRDVIGQKKSTGSHDAPYTVFLTTFTNKAVPGFKMYGTVDVPNDDSMTFEQRANSFFDVITYNSNFTGVQDTEAFMKFFAEEYPDEFFIRLMQDTDATGKSTWKVVSTDKAPTQSTMTELPDSGITLDYDATALTWSAKE